MLEKIHPSDEERNFIQYLAKALGYTTDKKWETIFNDYSIGKQKALVMRGLKKYLGKQGVEFNAPNQVYSREAAVRPPTIPNEKRSFLQDFKQFLAEKTGKTGVKPLAGGASGEGGSRGGFDPDSDYPFGRENYDEEGVLKPIVTQRPLPPAKETSDGVTKTHDAGGNLTSTQETRPSKIFSNFEKPGERDWELLPDGTVRKYVNPADKSKGYIDMPAESMVWAKETKDGKEYAVPKLAGETGQALTEEEAFAKMMNVAPSGIDYETKKLHGYFPLTYKQLMAERKQGKKNKMIQSKRFNAGIKAIAAGADPASVFGGDFMDTGDTSGFKRPPAPTKQFPGSKEHELATAKAKGLEAVAKFMDAMRDEDGNLPEDWQEQVKSFVGQAASADKTPPPEIAAQIPEGKVVTLGNGSKWTKKNGTLIKVG